jgi:hypothetical protein
MHCGHPVPLRVGRSDMQEGLLHLFAYAEESCRLHRVAERIR